MQRLWKNLDGWLFALLLLVGAGAVGYLGTRYAHVADWTANGRVSLSPQSRAVLAKLHGPVEIVSYASPQGDLRAEIGGFLQRYRQAKPDLGLRFVDPQQDPAQMRELGISVDGELILHYRGHEQRLAELSERSVTNALERLIRGNDRIVAFVTGDGERLPGGQGNADMGALMGQLAQSKATDPNVKSYAGMLVDQHTASNNELTKIANEKGVEMPAAPKHSQRRDIEKMGKKSGSTFDRDFVRYEIKDHKKDIKEFEKAIKDVKDPDVKTWAERTLPTLREHLAAAEKLPEAGKNAAAMGASKK